MSYKIDTPAANAPADDDSKTVEMQVNKFLDTLVCSSLLADKDFDAASLAPVLTAETAFDRVLPAVLAQGPYSHLFVNKFPPGCEHVDPERWEDEFSEDCYVGPDEVDEIPLETRIMYPSGPRGYAAARQEVMNYIFEERLEATQWRKAERQREWERDHLKGKAVDLLREWLLLPRPLSLMNLTADSIALGLLDRTMALPSPTTGSVRDLVKETLSRQVKDVSIVDALVDSILDPLLSMLICMRLVEDFYDPPTFGFRGMILPGLLQDGEETRVVECGWDNKGKRHVLSMLPATAGEICRGSIAAISALAAVAHRLACCTGWIRSNEEDCLEALVDRWTSHPLGLGVALPAIKATILKWYAEEYRDHYFDCLLVEKFVPVLVDLEKRLGVNNYGPTDKGEKQKLAFSCRCEACAAAADFLQSEATWCDIQIATPEVHKCLYASVELQGPECVAAFPVSDEIVLLKKARGGRSHDIESTRKRKLHELQTEKDAKVANAQAMLASLREKPECKPGGRTLESCIYVRECLELIDVPDL